MEREYLYSYGGGAWGEGSRRTKAYILAQPKFAKVHPELMRRLFQLADAVIDAGGDYGFGGGWRSSEQQMLTFTSRYDRVSYWTSLYWDGSPSWPEKAGYYVHVRMAPSAPPGRSYHESTTPDGYALAVDMLGDHKLGNALAAQFGLKHFADVNSEPWHYQPVEIPTARRNYRGEFDDVSPPQEEPVLDYVHDPVRVYDSRETGGPFKAGEIRKVPVALGVAASIGGAVQSNGFWSICPDGKTPKGSFVNPRPDGSWTSWGTIPVKVVDGHVHVFSLTGGHLYIDTYATKRA